jgi:hypothetical protein
MSANRFSLLFRGAAQLVLLALLTLATTVLPAAPTAFNYAWNFDASDATPVNGFFRFTTSGLTPNTFQFQGGPNLHITSGTDGILGPFGWGASGPVQNGSSVSLRIAAPEGGTISSFTLSFQLWIINTWDGNGAWYNGTFYPNDFFQVALGSVNGRGCSQATDLFCETFTNSTVPKMSYGDSDLPGPVGATFSRWTPDASRQAQGNLPIEVAGDGYGIWDISLGTVNLATPVSELVLIFRGLQMQHGADESWALGRVQISGAGNSVDTNPDVEQIPEPATFALSALGLAGLLLARQKLRAQSNG